MSLGWEVTTEDILNVCVKNGEKITEAKADEILEQLDTGKIEREALRGDDMSEQTDNADIEIWEQIVDKNLL
jgi:hypothetical protein